MMIFRWGQLRRPIHALYTHSIVQYLLFVGFSLSFSHTHSLALFRSFVVRGKICWSLFAYFVVYLLIQFFHSFGLNPQNLARFYWEAWYFGVCSVFWKNKETKKKWEVEWIKPHEALYTLYRDVKMKMKWNDPILLYFIKCGYFDVPILSDAMTSSTTIIIIE